MLYMYEGKVLMDKKELNPTPGSSAKKTKSFMKIIKDYEAQKSSCDRE